MIKTKFIRIADLKPGMKIKSANEAGDVVFKTVTKVWNTIVPQEEQVCVEFENGTVVHCSANHPFMIWESGSIQQCYPTELTSEHRVLTEKGFTRVLTVDVGQENDIRYIDITVEGTHTFFTKETQEQEAVLTHNSQGGVRNASATVNMPIWHYQFDDFIVLKNNQGTDENRVRQMDYCVVLSAFFWRRLKTHGTITFFDPNQVPDLYAAFYQDHDLFEKLYVKYEQRKDLRTKTESAEKVFGWIMKERADTGRYYLLNIDNVANQGPYDPGVHPIYQTNLCCLVGETALLGTINGVDSSFTLEEAVDLVIGGEKVEVMSKNIENGELQYKPVSAALKTGVNRKVLKITDDVSGKSIVCTPDHRVFTKNRGWVRADALASTDILDVQ